MKKTAFLLIALLAGFCQANAQDKQLLAAGTEVPVVAAQDINAYDLKEGQTIDLVTADDVKLESGEVAIPKGSQVSARVRTSLQQRVLANQKRRLIIDVKEVKLPDGTTVPLCNGVASFTTSRNTADLDAVPLKLVSSSKLLIPTNHVIRAKVEVSQNIGK